MPTSTTLSCAAAVAVASVALTGVSGHVCLMHPKQRGDPVPTDLQPGDSLCYRRTPYCGGVAAPASVPAEFAATNTFVAGTYADLTFQQNLNHFWEKDPGTLDVSISYNLNPSQTDDDDSSWTVLKQFDDIPANDMVTQTNFTARVKLPSKAADHALLRFRYISHNVGEVDPTNNTDAIFYNCADIRLVANPTADDESPLVAEEAATTQKAVDPEAAEGCSLPAVLSIGAVETTRRGVINHQIYYDSDRKLVRWDRAGFIHEAGVFDTLTTISFYNETIHGQPATTHPEYVITNGTKTCVLYGADPMNEWKYGSDRGQQRLRQFSILDNGEHTFMQEYATSDLENRFVVKKMSATECVPVVEMHSESTLSFTHPVIGADAIPANAFDLPASCKKPLMGHGIATDR